VQHLWVGCGETEQKDAVEVSDARVKGYGFSVTVEV
jgi:hypothetical protein